MLELKYEIQANSYQIDGERGSIAIMEVCHRKDSAILIEKGATKQFAWGLCNSDSRYQDRMKDGIFLI